MREQLYAIREGAEVRVVPFVPLATDSGIDIL